MTNSFYPDGAAEHERVLRAEHKERVPDLKYQCADSEDVAQQQSIRDEIAKAEAEFNAKLKQIRGSLF